MERDGYKPTRGRINGDFNSHAHVERDREAALAKLKEDNFNSHAHVERDMTGY